MIMNAELEAFAEANRWPAPAKLNLFLHVVGKREDGYHLLQTVFQLLDFGDDLSFTLNTSGKIARDYDLGFDEQSDLCLRAARALQAKISAQQGVTISLTKRLPMGGGLGGGSSDAATVLIALNHLWQGGLTRDELAEIGLKLGADVPVFVRGRSAWGEGVGEQLTPIELPEQKWLVITPNISVSTAKIFSHKHLTAGAQMKRIRAFRKAPNLSFGENQLEPIVRAEYPAVEALFGWLQSAESVRTSQPRMSGSGGTVFIAIDNQEKAERLLAERPKNTSGFIANGVNFHPLYRA
jgi:4-diphosphocytidyl-2-C-methyl-D-erythritol kinase